MACFEQNLHNQISGGDSIQSTTFCGNQVVDTTFCSMAHYYITIGNAVAKDVHCEIIMSHGITMAHIMMLQCILMLLRPSFIMYYYTQ